MENKIIMIISRFGTLLEIFPLWWNSLMLDNYDVFQTYGHFLIIRDSEDIKKLYTKKYHEYSFYKSICLLENCMLEEEPFILKLNNEIYRINSKVSRIIDIKRFNDIFMVNENKYKKQIFFYIDGRIISKFVHKMIYDEEDNVYIPFMKRVIFPFIKKIKNYILSKNVFLPYDKRKFYIQNVDELDFERWKNITNEISNSRYKKDGLLYKITHLNHYFYRRKTKSLENEKRKLIKKCYGNQ